MEQTPMTSAEFAQATWDRLFQEKQGTCEGCYSAWMKAQDAQRANKKAERSEELRTETENRRSHYYQATQDMHAWLISHPMPAWKLANRAETEQPIREARWRREEKALRIALQSTLRRPLTDEEFENARSLFHYSMEQFEEVFSDTVKEREAAKAEKEPA
jgi:hypothetical protein